MAGSKPTSAAIAGFDWPAFVPVLLACAFALLNMLLPVSRPNEPVELMLFGALFVQPVLFAIWMVLGPGAEVKRLPITCALFVIVMLAEAFNVWSLLEQGITRGPRLLIPGLALLGFAAGALTLVRWFTGWRIRITPGATRDCLPANRFSVKFLLLWMTICAVLIVIVRRLAFERWSAPDGQTLILMSISTALLLLMLLPATCVSLAVLLPRLSVGVMLLWPLLWAGLIWLTIEMMLAAAAKFEIMPNDRKEITSFVITAQSGAVAAALLSSFVVRIAGVRLYNMRGMMPVAEHSASSQGAPTLAATKPLYGKNVFARRGEAIYKRDIEPQLTNVNENHFVAIDIETGQFEVDADEGAAADRLLARIPAAQTWVRRIGPPYVRRFGPTRRASS
jgi:hypothetical protein